MKTIKTHEDPAQLRAYMSKAFDLVCPAKRAERLAAEGRISPADAAHVSWRDRIAALVTQADLDAAGVTIDRVKSAIVFFTATEPVVSYERIGVAGEPGYLVLADGYRAGPAA